MKLGSYKPEQRGAQGMGPGQHHVKVTRWESIPPKDKGASSGVKFLFKDQQGHERWEWFYIINPNKDMSFPCGLLATFARACGLTKEELDDYELEGDRDEVGHGLLIGRELLITLEPGSRKGRSGMPLLEMTKVAPVLDEGFADPVAGDPDPDDDDDDMLF